MFGVCCSFAGRHPLQRQLHKFFRRLRFAFLLEVTDCFMGFDLFVTKRDESEHRFIGLFFFGCGCMRRARCFPCRSDAQLIL